MTWMYLIALVSFLAIDAVVLKFFMLPLFARHIGDMLREETQFGVPCTPVSSIFRHRNAHAIDFTLALSTRGRGE